MHLNNTSLILLILLKCIFTNSITPPSSQATSPTLPKTTTTTSQTEESKSKSKSKTKVVIGIDGGTESIRACCFNGKTGKSLSKACAIPYKTHHPNPGWAEQDPEIWYKHLCLAVRDCISSLKENVSQDQEEYEICGICIDTTCCSVVTLDEDYSPIRPSLLWMDVRSSKEASDILSICKNDPALNINNNGHGPISAEWLLPKVLWIYRNEYESTWKKCNYVCEYQDYINYKLTDNFVASSCNASVRWHWNGKEAIKNENSENEYPGRPISLYQKLGLEELLYKLPKKCVPMGTIVGTLTKQACIDLNLPYENQIPIAQGGPDAFVGMIGLGCIYPGNICLITGSSHLHCCVMDDDDSDDNDNGIYSNSAWGAYKGAPLTNISFMEGGQSSTGSIVKWTKDVLFNANGANGANLDYKTLDDEASTISPGSDGLIVLETFQGSRTPITDPTARGAIIGMTLSHTKGHIWRAILESICFGTRSCIEGLTLAAAIPSSSSSSGKKKNTNYNFDTITIAGGTINSKFWLQLQSNILGKVLIINENCNNAPLLGCAILASVGAGIYDTVEDAVCNMVREERRIVPNMEVYDAYTNLYENVYKKLLPTLQPIYHTLSTIRGGGDSTSPCNLTINNNNNKNHKKRDVIISPSILASDWSNIQNEIKNKIMTNNLTRIHIDIFDGVFIYSPDAFTFGPTMVKHMHNYIQKVNKGMNNNNTISLDVHLCVVNPQRYIKTLIESGANCIIFQWDAFLHNTTTNPLNDALQLAKEIKSYKNGTIECAISINPGTLIDNDIVSLLQSGHVDMINILAVNAGFGGQVFQKDVVLQKLQLLLQQLLNCKHKLKIMIDGGINSNTARLCLESIMSGNNDSIDDVILVSGSYLFGHKYGFDYGVKEMKDSMQQYYNT